MQAKPDLSAFDNLLSMPSSNKPRPMGAAMSQAQQPPPQPMGMMSMARPQQQSPMMAPTAASSVKPLSQNDINDLLG